MPSPLLICDIAATPSILPWLNQTASLTATLREHSGEARLDVLKQDWRQASWWDRQVLELQPGLVWQRDILMFSRDTACWFARSIIPENTWQANGDVFVRLQDEALGDIVFNHPDIERDRLTHYPVSPETIEYHWPDASLSRQASALWLRRSRFVVRQHFPFFLVELFLPSWLETLA